MKSKIFLFAVSFLIAAGANAQKGIDNGKPYGSGEDSIRCRTNISLFAPYAKSNNFKDAYPFWKAAYDECPGSGTNIYSYGSQIISWQIEQESDETKKAALIDELMKLFDNRVKYFGNDKRYGKDWIIAQKASKYNLYKGVDTDPGVIYKWLGDVIEEYKNNVEPLAISLYMFSSFKLLQSDLDKYKDQYVNDFLNCSAILDAQLAAAKAANNEKDIEGSTTRKAEIEQNFAGSGAADCDILQSIYASKVETNKDNLTFLKETMTLLRRLGCKESDVYIAASVYAYKIEPTAESAMGLGSKALKEKEYSTAEKYFNEAIGMTEESDIKADLYYALGAMAYQQSQYSKARDYSRKCLAEKSEYGKAYIIIAQCYAATAKNIFSDDPVLTKCVYYAVVDKLERARQVDPSCAAEAGRLIYTYSQHFPSKEDVFMHPSINSGDSFTIGGWINEVVKIR